MELLGEGGTADGPGGGGGGGGGETAADGGAAVVDSSAFLLREAARLGLGATLGATLGDSPFSLSVLSERAREEANLLPGSHQKYIAEAVTCEIH